MSEGESKKKLKNFRDENGLVITEKPNISSVNPKSLLKPKGNTFIQDPYENAR